MDKSDRLTKGSFIPNEVENYPNLRRLAFHWRNTVINLAVLLPVPSINSCASTYSPQRKDKGYLLDRSRGGGIVFS
jgi:hypothetical protein